MRFLVPSSRLGTMWRLVLAALLVVGGSAGAVATAGLLQFSTLAKDISVHPGVKIKQLVLPQPGAPETILLIGSDHRYGESFRTSNTDTILLVRLNAASSTINVMSIPRDLKVSVPSHYVPPVNCSPSTVPGDCAEKINAAYSQGGYGLLISTIKSNVFPDLQITHIVDTNFQGFSDLVDAIGCVYTDVDHRYYNISSGPPGGPNNFSSIDIQPGYQRLCGDNQAIDGALPFVRFRHTDSDIVREARQQDFLRWAKQNFTTAQLFSERDRLLSIFSKHSTTDHELQTQNGLIDLFNLLLHLNGGTIKQTPFPANLSQASTGDDFVLAEPSQEQSAFRQFMRPTRKTSSSTTSSTTASHTGAGGARAGHHHAANPAAIGLYADPADGAAQAKVLTPDMPVYYPRLLQTSAQNGASHYCTTLSEACIDPAEPAYAYAHSYPRQYTVRKPDGARVHAYFMTVVINAGLGEYYGVQGLHWTDPPILRDPQATKVFRGRTYDLFEDDGGHITDVSFRVGPDVYWISNTLTSELTNHQIVGIAESMTRYRG